MLVPIASADFSKTEHNFGKVEINKPHFATFEFANITSAPAILQVHEKQTDAGKCTVLEYTKTPILPSQSGKVSLRCYFRETGYHSQSINVTVIERKSRYQKKLSYRAEAFHKVLKVTPKPKPPQQEVKHTANKTYPKQPDVDLNLGTPLQSMPIGDQDGVGICYAFASATAIEYELRNQGLKRTISPIDTGFVIKSWREIDDTNLDYGNFSKTVEEVRRHGVASKECIDKVIKKETAGTLMTSEKFINFIQKIYLLQDSEKTETEIEKEMDLLCKSYGVSTGALEDYIKDLQVPLRTYLRNLFADCEHERNQVKAKKLPQFLTYYPVPHDEMKAKIDYFLNKKKPVITTLCAEILMGKPDHKGLTEKREMKRDQKNKGLCSAHAVVITGRKDIDGQTNYLIRNSWGANYQSKGLTCACKTSGPYYSDCSKAPSSAANKVITGCWVPEDKLIPNMMRVGGFK